MFVNRGPTLPDGVAAPPLDAIATTSTVDAAVLATLPPPDMMPAPESHEILNDLLRRAVGDPAAFASFYTRTVDEILQFFRRRVFDIDLSADLTAETYAQLLRSVRKFDPVHGSARQYLYGVAKNHYLLWQRKGVVSHRHRHAVGIVELPAWESAEDATVDRLDAERLHGRLGNAMALLTAPERDAITMRILDGRAYREIAVSLGCTEVTARVRVSRGLAKLAAILDQERPT